MLSDIVLWMFVVCSGIAVGAGLYELRVNVPDGSRPIEVRRGPSMLTAITADDSERRFWVTLQRYR